MRDDVHQRLQEIEDAYFDGATYDALCEKIVGTAAVIASLSKTDPIREGAEVFAPLLWGGSSGAPIKPAAVAAALAGSDGDSYLRSWSSIGRGLSAYRMVA